MVTKLLGVAALGAATVGLTACGGGGGGGSAPPVVSQTGPAPVTNRLVFMAPFAAMGAGGSPTTSGPGADANLIGITDPDAPEAADFSQMNLDGDENIRVLVNSGGVTTDLTFNGGGVASRQFTATGSFDLRWEGVLGARGIDLLTYGYGTGSQGLLELPTLYEGDRPLTGPGLGAGDPTDYVRVARWSMSGAGSPRGVALIGSVATPASIPMLGKARFQGEALGRYWPAAGGRSPDVLGRVTLDIDFAASRLRGAVANLYGGDYPAYSPRLDFSFEAALSGGRFASSNLVAPFVTGETGAVYGQLYGPGGDLEAGGAFNMNFDGGTLVGAFVAGRPTAQTGFGDDNLLTLRPSFARLKTAAGVADGSFNQNDVDVGGGGNLEFVRYTAGSLLEGDEAYYIAEQNGALPLAVEFGPASLIGLTGGRRPSSGRDWGIDTWQVGSQTLRRFPLAGLVNGEWRRPILAQGLEYEVDLGSSAELHYFALGPRAIQTDMPTIGAARFRGEAIGYQAEVATARRHSTSALATVDLMFASGQVRGALTHINAGPTADGFTPTLALNEVNFTSSLDPRGYFLASVSQAFGASDTLTGDVHGQFYGTDPGVPPELGGVYAFDVAGKGAWAGVFVGMYNAFTPGLGYAGPEIFTDVGGASRFATSVQPLTNISFTWDRRTPGPADDTATLRFTSVAGAVDAAYPALGGSAPHYWSSTIIDGRVSEIHSDGRDVTFVPSTLTTIEQAAGMDLSYSSLVGWNDATNVPRLFIAVGQRTADMPTSGSATYAGNVFGYYTPGGAGSPGDAPRGTLSMTANFGAGSLSGSTTMQRAGVTPDLSFGFSASISGPQFAGSFQTNDGAFSGPLAGMFAGPAAAEAVGTFMATTAPPGTSFAGGFVAKKK